MEHPAQNAPRLVFITASSFKEARRLAKSLLEERLAACVTCIPNAESHYWWQGKIEKAKEVVLLVKTTFRRVPRLMKRIRSLHSYSTPEIIACDITSGDTDYLKWLREAVGK